MKHTFKKKIVIVDDHPMMRKGLERILEAEPDYKIIAQFEKAENAIQSIQEVHPDLIIADVSLPGMNGIELVKNMVFQNPAIKILVLSRHEESLYAERALRAGARGYVMKTEPNLVLLKAVRKVLNGGIYVSDEIGEKLLMNAMSGRKLSMEEPCSVLSDRELEVFEHIGRGRSNREIAQKLHLTVKTIETYRSRIKVKMGFSNSIEILFHAMKCVENEDDE